MDTSIHKRPLVLVVVTTVYTNLVCGVQDRLILNAFDTQQDFKTKPRTIRGLSQANIRMYHSPRADFFFAQLGCSGLDRAQEAC